MPEIQKQKTLWRQKSAVTQEISVTQEIFEGFFSVNETVKSIPILCSKIKIMFASIKIVFADTIKINDCKFRKESHVIVVLGANRLNIILSKKA